MKRSKTFRLPPGILERLLWDKENEYEDLTSVVIRNLDKALPKKPKKLAVENEAAK